MNSPAVSRLKSMMEANRLHVETHDHKIRNLKVSLKLYKLESYKSMWNLSRLNFFEVNGKNKQDFYIKNRVSFEEEFRV